MEQRVERHGGPAAAAGEAAARRVRRSEVKRDGNHAARLTPSIAAWQATQRVANGNAFKRLGAI